MSALEREQCGPRLCVDTVTAMDSAPNPPGVDVSTLLSVGIVALVIYLVVTAGLIALAIWIQYAIIWHAVRRGIREYFGPTPPNPYGTWSS